MSDARQAIDDRFPTLANRGYTVTSPRNDEYNCVAWIARDLSHWWEPALDGGFWPREVDEDDLDDGDLQEYVDIFVSLGFEPCANDCLESDHEKIAIYADENDFQHVAYQRSDGTWSSKLGKLNDVRHADAASLSGPNAFEYPPVCMWMRRRREPHELADSPTGLLLP